MDSGWRWSYEMAGEIEEVEESASRSWKTEDYYGGSPTNLHYSESSRSSSPPSPSLNKLLLFDMGLEKKSKMMMMMRDEEKWCWMRSQLVGAGVELDTPFGKPILTYADHTASGMCLRYVESFIIQSVLPFYDRLSDSISEHLGYIIDLKGNIAALMNETNELKRKREEFEEDVMEAESIGKKRLRRVDDWFIDVDKIIPEIESIKLEFDQRTISPFSWRKLGKRVVNRIEDVKKLQDKGVFDEVAKSPRQPPAHQRTWEARSAENVYLGTAVGRVEVELAACRIRLAKLEAELSCLKAQRDSVTDGSAGAAAAVPVQTAKRPGRAKRPIASVSSLPSDQR